MAFWSCRCVEDQPMYLGECSSLLVSKLWGTALSLSHECEFQQFLRQGNILQGVCIEKLLCFSISSKKWYQWAAGTGCATKFRPRVLLQSVVWRPGKFVNWKWFPKQCLSVLLYFSLVSAAASPLPIGNAHRTFIPLANFIPEWQTDKSSQRHQVSTFFFFLFFIKMVAEQGRDTPIHILPGGMSTGWASPLSVWRVSQQMQSLEAATRKLPLALPDVRARGREGRNRREGEDES